VVEIRDAELRERFEALNSAHSTQPRRRVHLLPVLSQQQSGRAHVLALAQRHLRDRTNAYWPPSKTSRRSQPVWSDHHCADGQHVSAAARDAPARGLSLDWLASSLARTGIGLLPLATFARTEKGSKPGARRSADAGRRRWRGDHVGETRRLLIDLQSPDRRGGSALQPPPVEVQRATDTGSRVVELTHAWDEITAKICGSTKPAGFAAHERVSHRSMRRSCSANLCGVRAAATGSVPHPLARSRSDQR